MSTSISGSFNIEHPCQFTISSVLGFSSAGLRGALCLWCCQIRSVTRQRINLEGDTCRHLGLFRSTLPGFSYCRQFSRISSVHWLQPSSWPGFMDPGGSRLWATDDTAAISGRRAPIAARQLLP